MVSPKASETFINSAVRNTVSKSAEELSLLKHLYESFEKQIEAANTWFACIDAVYGGTDVSLHAISEVLRPHLSPGHAERLNEELSNLQERVQDSDRKAMSKILVLREKLDQTSAMMEEGREALAKMDCKTAWKLAKDIKKINDDYQQMIEGLVKEVATLRGLVV